MGAVWTVAVVVTGLDGAVQVVIAMMLGVDPPATISGLAHTLLTRNLLGDPHSVLAAHLDAEPNHFGAGTVRSFAVVYLMAHGAVKLAATWTLLVGRRPVTGIAIGALGVLAAAELWRAVDTTSIVVLAAAALDIAIIFVIGRNYRRLRQHISEDGDHV